MLIPASRVEIIAASGHLANAEQPDQFNEAIDRFLRAIETPA
jgi:pimeloyl-ACP methyl ester carboxylesterase